MAHQVIEIKCPSCGAPVTTGQNECEWCHNPVIISTFNSVYAMSPRELNTYANSYRQSLAADPENKELNTSIAMCYLRLKNYEKALHSFELAMEDNFDNSETFFYAAVCLLGGKKAFLAPRPVIDKALEYINAAIMIEPRGIYYYLMAYIKYDYFARKRFKTSPTYEEALDMAQQAGYSSHDLTQLYTILNVERPSCL